MPYLDKEKQRKCQREFLHKKKRENPTWHAAVKRNMRHKRATNRDIVTLMKKHLGCLLCEEDDPDKLQFHHVLQEFKTATVADLLSSRAKLIKVICEIDKCVCVCSACHMKLGASTQFLKATLNNERWASDWGVVEALEWLRSHPQSRLRNGNFMDVLKGVMMTYQMQDAARLSAAAIGFR